MYVYDASLHLVQFKRMGISPNLTRDSIGRVPTHLRNGLTRNDSYNALNHISR